MTEKINGQGVRPSETANARRSEATRAARDERSGAAAADKPAAASGDTVNITRSGLLMSKLEEVVQRTPVVDTERVAAIKEAIAAGTYEVDDQQIADKILKFDRDVLG
jgi:negative regulator of flagellin synthesis FlgM